MSREPDNRDTQPGGPGPLHEESAETAPDPRLERILTKLKSLPAAPGVYLHKNKQGKVIYVGKANRLNQRVRSYFRDNVEDEKTRLLVARVHDVDYIVTESGNDALVLENQLINVSISPPTHSSMAVFRPCSFAVRPMASTSISLDPR